MNNKKGKNDSLTEVGKNHIAHLLQWLSVLPGSSLATLAQLCDPYFCTARASCASSSSVKGPNLMSGDRMLCHLQPPEDMSENIKQANHNATFTQP